MSSTRAPAAIAVAFALALSGAAIAQNDFDPVMPEDEAAKLSFEQLDADGDGYIVKSDIPAGHALSLEFAAADSNRDSRLDRAEFNAFMDDSLKDAEEE